MPRYIGLLRGINVGGHRVTMDALRRHFTALKFAHVETFIASGNVLFDTRETDTAALENTIEQHLAAKLGYVVATFLRTPDELAAVVQRRPFASDDRANEAISRYVLFLRVPLSSSVQRAIEKLSCATDEFRVQGREIHWLCRGKISDPTPAAKELEKVLSSAQVDLTSRNVRMLQRLVTEKLAIASDAHPGSVVARPRRLSSAGKAGAGRARKA